MISAQDVQLSINLVDLLDDCVGIFRQNQTVAAQLEHLFTQVGNQLTTLVQSADLIHLVLSSLRGRVCSTADELGAAVQNSLQLHIKVRHR